MKAKYTEKRSKYSIARNVGIGVLICFGMSYNIFKSHVRLAIYIPIPSSKKKCNKNWERNIALYLPPIAIPFVLHLRDTWAGGGKYPWGGEKWHVGKAPSA